MSEDKPWLHEGGGRTKFHYQCGSQCVPVFAPENEGEQND